MGIYLLVAFIYAFVAFKVLYKNEKRLQNRLGFITAFLLTVWAVLCAISRYEEPMIDPISGYAVFGWGVLYTMLLHVSLMISGMDKKVKHQWFLLLMYFPSIMNIILYIPESPVLLSLTDFLFLTNESVSIIHNYFIRFYYIIYVGTTIGVLVVWQYTTKIVAEKRQAQAIWQTTLIAYSIGAPYMLSMDYAEVITLQGHMIFLALLPGAGILLAVERYGLLSFEPKDVVMDVFQIMDEGLIICTPEGYISSINYGAKKILGVEAAKTTNVFDIPFKNTLTLNEIRTKEVEIILDEVNHRHLLLHIHGLRDKMNYVSSYLIIFQDITNIIHAREELKELNNQLIVEKQYLADYDQLTGLPNLFMFNNQVKAKTEECDDHQCGFAIGILDIDDFKNINDTKGHDFGDRLIVEVVNRLKSICPDASKMARAGGDQFFIIFEDVESEVALKRRMERIMILFDRPFVLDNNELYVSVSIGTTLYPDHGKTPGELIKYADIAMNHVKERGKKHFGIFDSSLYQDLMLEQELKNQIVDGVREGQFELYFQPQINAETDCIVGAEALVRWNHPDRGLLGPGAFVGIAEKYGTIQDLGYWIIEEAMIKHLEWIDYLAVDFPMSVNLSVDQLRSKKIISQIRGLIEKYEYPIHLMKFEVTESLFMESDSYPASVLKELKALGCKIIIDDFGVKYSSLNYIKVLPISTIKIDKSFVDGIGHNIKDEAIIKTMTSLGRDLDIEIIAEGVEDLDQIEFLRNIGCMNIQGYYYSRPLRDKKMRSFIRNYGLTLKEERAKIIG